MPRVLGYTLRRAEPEEARDVVAEVFTVAWRRLESVPEGDGEMPWLLATSRKVLANRRRREETRQHTPTAQRAVSDPAESVPGVMAIASAFRRLGEGDREVLALVAWDGLEPREAAVVLECSAGTFGVRLHRARRRLAALLEETDTDAPLATEERP